MISWGMGPWGGKGDPVAWFTGCRSQTLGGPVLCSQSMETAPLSPPSSENRAPFIAVSAREDLRKRCQEHLGQSHHC